MFDWRWDFVIEILPRLLSATGYTLLAAGIGYLIAVVLGIVFLLGQRTPYWLVNRIVREAVEFIRSTPLVLQLFFVFFVGPQVGIRLSPWTSGMFTIGLHYASYLSEVYRAGLESVPKEQWEVARALNFSTPRTYCRIILPQALPPSIAGMGNYLVGIFKDTPMLSVIGVTELMHTANAIGAEHYRFLEPYTMVGVIFLLISLPAAALVKGFDRWVRMRAGVQK